MNAGFGDSDFWDLPSSKVDILFYVSTLCFVEIDVVFSLFADL